MKNICQLFIIIFVATNSFILRMNYLAHALLSFNNEGVLGGNMISDYVKGKSKYTYPEIMQKGIHLHRLIDEFTDIHAVTAFAKSFFRPQYRLYSGAFVDVVYDHFLALDMQQYIAFDNLENFTQITYHSLEKNLILFPSRFQKMFPYMKTQNWLFNYQFKDGIQKSFQGLVYRAAYLNESAIAFEIFNNHYIELQSCYYEFFPSLKMYAFENFNKLMTG